MATLANEGPCRYLTPDSFSQKENIPGYGEVIVEYPGCSIGGRTVAACIFCRQRLFSPKESDCSLAQSMALNTPKGSPLQDAEGFDA
jgi:hypothetical protein